MRQRVLVGLLGATLVVAYFVDLSRERRQFLGILAVVAVPVAAVALLAFIRNKLRG